MIPVTRKSLSILGGILLAQVALAVILLMPQNQGADPLVTFDVQSVDQIRVSGMEEALIELSLQEGLWLMPGDLRVDSSRIDSLFEVLSSDRWTWPVAATDEAAERFEVTEETFQRKLALYSGDETVATLYLGTSPSFRRIHVRESNSEKIYAIELATYDLPLDQDDWLDKTLIQTAGSLDAMSRVGAWQAELVSDGEWRFLDPSLQANSRELSSMATRFETLRVMGLAEERPEREPDIEFEVTAAGESVRYAFYRPEESEQEDDEESEDSSDEDGDQEAPRFDTAIRDTLVKSSLRDEFFRVSSYTLDQLEKPIEDLVEEVEAVEEVEEVEQEGADSVEPDAELAEET